jgi:hypothetical protein
MPDMSKPSKKKPVTSQRGPGRPVGWRAKYPTGIIRLPEKLIGELHEVADVVGSMSEGGMAVLPIIRAARIAGRLGVEAKNGKDSA